MLIIDELTIQNGTLTTEQQTRLEESISRHYHTRQQIVLSMQEQINELYLWQQGLSTPIHAPLPYCSSPVPQNPFSGRGGEVSLMFTPFWGTVLQLVPRANHPADDIALSDSISGKPPF